MLGEPWFVLEPAVEGDDPPNRDGDGHGLDDGDPDVGELGIEGVVAVCSGCLGDSLGDCGDDLDNHVAENGEVFCLALRQLSGFLIEGRSNQPCTSGDSLQGGYRTLCPLRTCHLAFSDFRDSRSKHL